MSKSNDFEKELRAELGKPGDGAYDLGGEDTLREMLVSTFRGRLKWVGAIAWAYMFLFGGVAVFAAVQFFLVGTVREMILYATAFLAAIAVVMVCKLWCWMIINRNCIQREVKRLEIRIAELAEKLSRA
jgi:hypothetical protein